MNFICKDANYKNDIYCISKKENVKEALKFNGNIKLKLVIYKSNTNILDEYMLGKLHSLDLHVSDISDVSILGTVHTLNLSSCVSITDVSKLYNVQDLNISCCGGITDVSMLHEDRFFYVR
jgi:hypothetical protein